jgi:hypothetical protein
MLFLQGNLAGLIPIPRGFFLASQKRMVYRESKHGFNLAKREPERPVSVSLQVFP